MPRPGVAIFCLAWLCNLAHAQQTEAGLKPELLEAFGRKHYFQAPSKPRGLVAMLPGCARAVYGFWPYSANKDFWGFPEDVSHSKQVLKKGYAMLVMTPNDQAHLCWSSKGRDIDDVVAIIQQLQEKLQLQRLSVYLMGASSGGSVAYGIASSGKFKVGGFISEVSTHTVVTEGAPPTVWVVMERDMQSQDDAKALLAQMHKLGKRAASIISPVRRITPTFFSEQMAAISPQESAQIASALEKLAVIDESGKIMIDINSKDASKPDAWDKKLGKMLPSMGKTPATSLVFRRSGIWQAMLAAYAHHEHTSEYTTAALTWFEGESGDFAGLAALLAVAKPAYFSAIPDAILVANASASVVAESGVPI